MSQTVNTATTVERLTSLHCGIGPSARRDSRLFVHRRVAPHGRGDSLHHALERVGFCRTHQRALALLNHPDYRGRVGGSRFLEVDPVEGGSCNDYDYVCANPVNAFDLAGTFCFHGHCVHAPPVVNHSVGRAQHALARGGRALGRTADWARRCFDCIATTIQIGLAFYLGIVGGIAISVAGVAACVTGGPAGCVAGAPFIVGGVFVTIGSVYGLYRTIRSGGFNPNRYMSG
jgi:hypothetical protein